MAQMATEHLILFDRTSSYHELTSSIFRQAGIAPRGYLEVDNIDAAKRMVEQRLGIALLPLTSVRVGDRDGAPLPGHGRRHGAGAPPDRGRPASGRRGAFGGRVELPRHAR